MTAGRVYRHSHTARLVLRSLVPVICPPEAIPLGDAIVEHMALTLGAFPATIRLGFTAGLAGYDLGALPRYRRRARSLRGDRAEHYYASWAASSIGLQVQVTRVIKQLMSLSCYEQPQMMERVGYRPGPWIAEATRRRLTLHRDDVERQAQQVLAPDPLRPGVRVKQDPA